MRIEDYLPYCIKFEENLGYTKYDKLFYMGQVSMYFDIYFTSDKAIVKYVISKMALPYTKDDIILYDGDKKDYNYVIEKSIESFNEYIGNIYDFVDIYRKRNLILLNL